MKNLIIKAMPFIFLLIYLFIEVALMVLIGGEIGVGWTFLWIVAGFFIGFLMLKTGGEKSREWLRRASAGEQDGKATKQIYWYIGGLMVILPGFFTDIIGVLLVFGPTQAVINWFASLFIPESLQTGYTVISSFSRTERSTSNNGEVIEGQSEEIIEEQNQTPPRENNPNSSA